VTSTVSGDTTTSEDVAAVRYGGFVAIDLPLLPF
jgi:hypothetical protein